MTPIQLAGADHVNNLMDTTLQQAQANTYFSVHAQCEKLNAQVKAGYLQKFTDRALDASNHGVDLVNPPLPPPSYVIVLLPAPEDSTGALWPVPSQTGPPVCDMPPLPGVVHHSLGRGEIGVRLPGQTVWFSRLEGDTTPDGEEAPGTSQDGVTGIFRKVGSPFGSNPATGQVGGWFLLVRPL